VTQHKVKPPASHDLLGLARRSGIKLFGTEGHLLKRLTQFVVWSGRYPAPKISAKGEIAIIYSSDWDDFESLYGRLSQLTEAVKPGSQ